MAINCIYVLMSVNIIACNRPKNLGNPQTYLKAFEVALASFHFLQPPVFWQHSDAAEGFSSSQLHYSADNPCLRRSEAGFASKILDN